MRRRILAAALAVIAARAPTAQAAGPWAARPDTLPKGVFAFDVGLGGVHAPATDTTSITGFGVNLEATFGVTSRLQLGLRTGIRAGLDGRVTGADAYGRLYDSINFGTRSSPIANPEFAITGNVSRGEHVEVALQGRVFLPAETNSSAGLVFGVPVRFRVGQVARIDTGGFVPLIFSNPLQSGLVVPVDIWFQVSDRVWLGPMTGMRFRRAGQDLRIGFGLGVQAASFLDFKAQLVVPAVNQDQGGRFYGFGVGVELRVE